MQDNLTHLDKTQVAPPYFLANLSGCEIVKVQTAAISGILANVFSPLILPKSDSTEQRN